MVLTAKARLILGPALLGLILLFGVGCASGSSTPTSPGDGSGAPEGRTIVRTANASLVITAKDSDVQPLGGVEILPKEVVVLAGQPFVFVARVFDTHGEAAANVSLKWQLLDTSVGIINDRGFFQSGTKPGRYMDAIKVEATQNTNGQASKQVAYATVTIVAETRQAPIVRVDVLPQEIILSASQPFVFSALSYDAFGNLVPAVRYEWQIQSTDVGSINSLGFLRAGDTPGRYEDAIKVAALQALEGETVKKEAFATVTIVPEEEDAYMARVEILPQDVSLPSGYSLAFMAVAYDGHGNMVPGVRFRWRMKDSQAGTINSWGYFHAEGEPKEYKDAISVEAIQDHNGDKVRGVAFASVMVTPSITGGRLERVAVLPQKVTINPGQPLNFSAVAYDASGNPLTDVQFLWGLEDPRIGDLSSRGLFRAAATPGRHLKSIKVEAIQVLDGVEIRREVYADVTVPGPISRMEVNPSTATVAAGDAFVFSAIAYDAQGVAIPGLSYRWRLLDPKAGTMNNAGILISGDEPGEYPNAIEVEVKQVYPDASP